MTTGKTIALTIWIFVSKAMSLLFNTLIILPRLYFVVIQRYLMLRTLGGTFVIYGNIKVEFNLEPSKYRRVRVVREERY